MSVSSAALDLSSPLLEQVVASQRLASDPQVSVWVAASAGSGKTKILTDRLLRLLLEGVPPEKILCLTFTRAAASEMRQRLFNVLEEWCLHPPYESLTKLLGEAPSPALLKKASTLFYHLIDHQDRLRIMTLHGFCQSILQQFPLEGGCLPGFKILEEAQALLLLKQSFQSLVKRADLKPFLDKMLATMAPTRLQQLLEEAPRRRWMSVSTLQEKLDYLPIEPSFVLTPCLRERLSLFEYGSAADQRRALVMKKFCEGNLAFKDLVPIFLTQKGETRTNLATKSFLKHDASLEKILKAEALRVQTHLKHTEAEALLALHTAFITLHQEMQAGYKREKQAQGAFDFQDILEKTFHLLNDPALGPWVLFKITKNLDHILVDEAQDTSSLQWAIVLKITEDFFTGRSHRVRQPTLFVVGDFKQSIYGFQGAAPHLFQSMQRYYQEKIHQARSSFRDISLEASFRSTPQILEVVDRVFQQDPLAQNGLLTQHASIRSHSQGTVQRWPLVCESEDAQASFKMADQLASFIATSLKKGFRVPNGHQAVSPGDFLILVQRRHLFLYQMIRALKRYGVPVMGADRYALQEDLIVKDILALFRFLLFPYDNFSLATVLISPLIGWRYEEVLKKVEDHPQQPLWQKISNEPTVEVLRQFLKKTDHIHPSEILFEVVERDNRRTKIQQRLGQNALASVDALLYTVLEYEATHLPSLQGFVEWFEEQSVVIKRDVAQNPRNEVRLMTVHGAKGLQAPIVILPDTLRLPDRPPLFLEDEGEVILNMGNKGLHPYLNRLAAQHQAKAYEEYQRLLYVALTRAENHLIIAGWSNKEEISSDCWYHWLQKVIPLPANPQKEEEISTPSFRNEKLKAVGNSPPRPTFMETTPLPETRTDFETATSKTFSQISESSHLFTRGLDIHRALERYILSREPSPLIQNILEVPSLKELLDQALPEVPLVGVLDSRLYSVRIDCIIHKGNNLKIIDFKSDQQPSDDIPLAYQEQLTLYKRLAEKTFIDHTVETYILWTTSARLIRHS